MEQQLTESRDNIILDIQKRINRVMTMLEAAKYLNSYHKDSEQNIEENS